MPLTHPGNTLDFFNHIMQAPVALGVVRGQNHTIEFANNELLQLWGKTQDVIGKPIVEALPEIVGQQMPDLLDRVFETGEEYHGYEMLIYTLRDGVREQGYFNFTYAPLRNGNGKVTGVTIVANDVTSQVKAKIELEKSEKRFRNLVAEADVATAIYVGEEMMIQLANDAMIKVWNKDRSVIGCPLRDALPELEGQPFHDLLQNVYQTGETYWGKEDAVNFMIEGKLQTFYFNFSYKALRDAKGKVYGILNQAIDVTDSVIAKKQIAESEERLRLATEATGVGTWDINLETYEIVYSTKLNEIFGYAPDVKLTRDQLAEHLNPEDKDTVVKHAIYRAMETGDYFYEARITREDGELRWIRTHGNLSFDESGKPVRMLGTILDITEQKIAQQKIQESEAYFREVSNFVPVNVWQTAPDGYCTFLNQRWYEYTGLTPEQSLGYGWLDAIHPDDREHTAHVFDEANEKHTLYHSEYRLRAADGSYRWKLDEGLPRISEQGEYQGMIGAIVDIHEQKKTADELEHLVRERTTALEEANEDLTHSNKELEQFAFVTSHDLQEPLRKIRTFTSLLAQQNKELLNDRGRMYIDKITGSAQRMSDLISGLLNFSRLQRSTEGFSQVDMNNVLKNVEEDFEVAIEQKNAVIKSDDLPTIEAKPIQMNQLLFNIIGNALKFTKEGTTPFIEINVSEPNSDEIAKFSVLNANTHYIKLTIKDNGIGFDEQYSEKIFEIFQRLNDRGVYEGTGIGLAMCSKIVANHNGVIYARSNANEGATFHIILPSKQDQAIGNE